VVKHVLKVIEDVWSVDREPLTCCTWCYTCKKHKFLLSKGPSIGSPLLFICDATHIKKPKFLLSKGPPIGSPLLSVYGAKHVKSLSFC
jgi:hypothetical protein